MRRPGARGNRNLLHRPGSRLSLFFGLCGALPVIQHLTSQYHVQSKSGNEAVENELVINLLQSSKDARERSNEIVEDLDKHDLSAICKPYIRSQ